MSLDAQKRAAAVTNSMPLVDSPADSNRKAFLDLAGLQLESTESLSDQMRSLPPIAALKQAVHRREVDTRHLQAVLDGRGPR
jgi:hypothetical protein